MLPNPLPVFLVSRSLSPECLAGVVGFVAINFVTTQLGMC